jgi:hypothetical protein
MNFIEKFVVNIVVPFLILLAIVTALALVVHATTTSHSNSIGVPMSQDNPYTYKVGSVAVAGMPEDAIVLRIQPLATYSLFTEDILFCNRNSVAEMFEGKTIPVVLTYKTKATHMVQGIGCHALIRVDELKETR